MVIYAANIILMVLINEILTTPSPRLTPKSPKKAFCICATIQWVLISGLRHKSIGADTWGYKNDFELIAETSWNSLIRSFNNIIFNGGEGKDPGYKILEKAFQIFSQNYQMWLVFIAIVFTVSMAIWIYKHSEDVLMSFLIYSCLFSSFFAITGHRQTIATAVVVFLGDFLIKKRKLFSFVTLVLIMSTIHKSCLIFMPFYFLYNKKITTPYIIILLFVTVVSFVFRSSLIEFLSESSGYDYSKIEGAGAYTFTFMLVLIVFASLWRRPIILEEHPEAAQTYNALMLSLVFVPLTFVNPNMMRVVQYFSLYIMLMVPYILSSFKGRQKGYITVAVIGVLLFLYFRTPKNYMFFWQ